MFEKILVCLDGSHLSEQILPQVIEEATCFRSKIVLLHVLSEPAVVSAGIPGAMPAPEENPGILEQMEKEQEGASEYLERVGKQFTERGLEVEPVILQGSAGDAIVEYARENKVGMIAIATHGRSGLGRAVFGSVADYVLRESGLPVLVIKPRS